MSTPRLERPELLLDRLAAVDAADRDVLAVGELLELDDDLLDELAGRGQDDGLGPSAAGFEHLDERDAEGGRLAGARLGLADDVVAVEGFGDEFGLDGRWGEGSELVSGPGAVGAQPQGGKTGRGFLHCTLDQTNLLGMRVRDGTVGAGAGCSPASSILSQQYQV